MPSSQLVPSGRPVAADPSARGRAGESPAEATPDLVLDAAALARLAELDPRGEIKLLHRVMTTFHSSAMRLAAQLAAARAVDDRAAIRLVAHTLKSSSGYVGALHLARCCAELEAATHVAARDDLAPEIDAMTSALAVALAAVTRHLDP